MTPEALTDLLPGVALIVTATGSLIAAIVGALALRRSGKVLAKADAIETTTNGAARATSSEMRALRADIEHLKTQLSESRQAAADVRVAMEKAPTMDAHER